MRHVVSVLAILLLSACAGRGPATNSYSDQVDLEFRELAPGMVDADSARRSKALHSYLVGQLSYLNEDFERATKSLAEASALAQSPSADISAKLAELYLRSGRLPEALAECEKALAVEADNIKLLHLKAGILEALKKDVEAEPIYKQIIGKNPLHAETYVLLSGLQSRLGQHDAAMKTLKTMVLKLPSEPAGYYYLGRLYENQGKLVEAEAAFRKSYKLDPTRTVLADDLIRVLVRLKKYPELKVLCEQVLARDPEHVLARKVIAQLLVGNKELDAALAHFRILEDIESDSSETRFRIALIEIEKQNFSEAIRELSLVIAQHSDHPQARFYLGSVYASAGQQAEALDELGRIASDHPMYVKGRLLASVLLRQTKQYGEAEAAMRSALEKEPGNPQLIHYLVLVLQDAGELDAALELLEEAVGKSPQDGALLFQYGTLLHESGDEPGAVKAMERVIAANSANAEALNYVAYALAESRQDLDRAEQYVSRALKINPSSPYYLDTLGWCQFIRGKYSEAVETLKRAVQLGGEDIVILEHLGDAYIALGRTEDGFQTYLSAVEKNATVADQDGKEALIRVNEKLNILKKR